MKFTIVGSALAGNKGAAAMLESSIQTLSKKYPGAKFVLLSIYPEEDIKLNTYDNLEILPASSFIIAFVLNPLALIYKIIPPLRKLILSKSPQLKAIKDSDALLDQGGITFTDGREIFLLYNVASILPAILLNTKVIKCAQALGPFNNPINRFVSKIILPHIKLIIARGKKTNQYLKDLGLKNVSLGTDYAFSLNIMPNDKKIAEKLYSKITKDLDLRDKLLVGISPSVVVKKKCEKKGIDYVSLMAWFIDDLAENNYATILIPHSVREDHTKLHNNDLPLSYEIYKKVKNKKNCAFINQQVSSQVLRHIIGKTDLFVACRFHAMISSLAMGVPTLVLGWSHKYMEILDVFGVKEFGLDSSKLTQKVLSDSFNNLAQQRNTVSRMLKKNLSTVKKLSLSHVDLIDKAIKN